MTDGYLSGPGTGQFSRLIIVICDGFLIIIGIASAGLHDPLYFHPIRVKDTSRLIDRLFGLFCHFNPRLIVFQFLIIDGYCHLILQIPLLTIAAGPAIAYCYHRVSRLCKIIHDVVFPVIQDSDLCRCGIAGRSLHEKAHFHTVRIKCFSGSIYSLFRLFHHLNVLRLHGIPVIHRNIKGGFQRLSVFRFISNRYRNGSRFRCIRHTYRKLGRFETPHPVSLTIGTNCQSFEIRFFPSLIDSLYRQRIDLNLVNHAVSRNRNGVIRKAGSVRRCDSDLYNVNARL